MRSSDQANETNPIYAFADGVATGLIPSIDELREICIALDRNAVPIQSLNTQFIPAMLSMIESTNPHFGSGIMEVIYRLPDAHAVMSPFMPRLLEALVDPSFTFSTARCLAKLVHNREIAVQVSGHADEILSLINAQPPPDILAALLTLLSETLLNCPNPTLATRLRPLADFLRFPSDVVQDSALGLIDVLMRRVPDALDCELKSWILPFVSGLGTSRAREFLLEFKPHDQRPLYALELIGRGCDELDERVLADPGAFSREDLERMLMVLSGDCPFRIRELVARMLSRGLRRWWRHLDDSQAERFFQVLCGFAEFTESSSTAFVVDWAWALCEIAKMDVGWLSRQGALEDVLATLGRFGDPVIVQKLEEIRDELEFYEVLCNPGK